MKNILFILIASLFIGCVPKDSSIAVNFTKSSKVISPSTVLSANVSSVQVINNQLVINGNGFTDVTKVKVDGTAFSENFSIESKTATKIIANSIRAFSFDVSKVFNVILSDAHASATFPIDFSLCNATLNGKGFNCSAPIADKDVLSYDAVSGTWKPRAVSGLNYLGAFNASSNPATGPATQPAGAYYIISASGTIASIPFTIGDWLVSNGSAWQKIDNSTAVLSVFGRNGTVTAQAGDYTLDMLGDISFPTAPVAGKVLKFDGTNWVAGDDLSGGGAGSVSTAEISDGTIVNADISAAAGIDYSKLNIADGDIPAAKISGLPVLSSILAATITDGDTTHAPTGEAVYEALQTKLGTNGGTLSVGTISGVPTPVNPSDVVNKAYVDGLVTLFDTDDIAEGSQLYFTEARVLGTDLAGLNTGVNGPITAADTVLSAFGKMQYQVTDLKAKGQWDKTVNDISYSAGNVSIDKKLRLKSDNANYVEMLSPNGLASTYTLTLPSNDGNANQVLKTDGTGVLAWVDVNDASVQAFAKSALPTCAAGEVLKSNGTTFSCITDNTGAGAFSGTANSAVITTAGGALGVSATTSTELGYVSGVTSAIQTQLNAKQSTDATLSALAGYNTNGILVQTAADTFVGRSIAGTANRVTVTNGDGVSGNPTIDIPTALLPSPVVGDVGKILKATATNTSVWSPLASGDVTTALGFTPINKGGDSVASGTFDFNGAAVIRTLDPILGTDVANKQYVDTMAGLWQVNGTKIYRSGTDNVGIGVSSPSNRLEVGTTTDSSNTIAVQASGTTALSLLNSTFGGLWVGVNYSGSTVNGITSNNMGMSVGNSNIVFASGSTRAERMRISNTGNVGIGTSSPGSLLHVNGILRAATLCDEVGANCQDLSSGIVPSLTGLSRGTDASPTIRFGTDTNSGIFSPNTDQVGISIAGGLIARYNNTAISFYKRFNVSNSNDVGIVPSLGTSSSSAIVNGTIVGEHVFDYGGRITPGRANISLRATEAFTTTAQGAAMDFVTINNGTTSATTKMTIENNGNVGIGTTTPTSPLTVNGTALIGNSSTGFTGTWNALVIGNTALGPHYIMDGGSTTNRIRTLWNSSKYSISKCVTDSCGSTSSMFSFDSSSKVFEIPGSKISLAGSTPTHDLEFPSGGTRRIGFDRTNTSESDLEIHAGAPPIGSTDRHGGDLILKSGISTGTGDSGIQFFTVAPSSTGTTDNNPSLRMQITPEGFVGVGNTSPTGRVDIKGSGQGGPGNGAAFNILRLGNASALDFGEYAGGDTWIQASNRSNYVTKQNLILNPDGGNIGIGTATPSYTLHVNGSVAGTGAYNSLSDARLKKDIEVIPNSLEKISALRGVSFNWDKEAHPELKLGDRGELGVIAQEVRKVFPDAVTVDKKTGILSVAYSMLIAPLIEAVKDLFNDSKELKREIASLKKDNELKAQQIKKNAEENQELKKRLDKIEKLLNKSK